MKYNEASRLVCGSTTLRICHEKDFCFCNKFSISADSQSSRSCPINENVDRIIVTLWKYLHFCDNRFWEATSKQFKPAIKGVQYLKRSSTVTSPKSSARAAWRSFQRFHIYQQATSHRRRVCVIKCLSQLLSHPFIILKVRICLYRSQFL